MRTLRNAVEGGRVHHAYLFVGSRGTGKTSMAKILAACLNCERGPTIEPCGQCESCRAIAAARSLDVIEMDAASNNSVDDIRELRESVAFAPVSGRSKVYILDEAHMLSHGGVERVPEDARGAAAEHRLRARDDRGAEGPGDGRRPLPPLRLPAPHGRADRRRRAPRGAGRVDRDPTGGDGRARARGDRQLPRRARPARAARHLQRQRDRAGRRARGAGCDRLRAPGRDDRRGGAGERPRRAARGRALRAERPRRGRVRGRPRGARARAAGRHDPRRGPRRARADRRGGHAPAGAGARACRRRPPCACWSSSARRSRP